MLSPVALALLVGEPYPLLSWVYVRSKLGVAGLFVLLSWVLIPAGALLAGAALLTVSIAAASSWRVSASDTRSFGCRAMRTSVLCLGKVGVVGIDSPWVSTV